MKLPEIRKLGIFLVSLLGARVRIRLPQPDQRTADHPRPGLIATERPAHVWRPGGEIGTDDRQRGRDIGAAVLQRITKRIPLELPQLRALGHSVELAAQRPPDQLPLDRDIIAGREHCGGDVAFWHFAAPQYPDGDPRALGDVAEDRAIVEVAIAVVERDDGAPLRIIAPTHLAFSSLLVASAMTGQYRPVAIVAIRSTR